ncbi:hypothetical protein MKK75_03825 [Methylobacterium sp. J-030]|uniref:hypothetical protein n=1 Tax=Methylobacterium sp. J-030 TaxID=2836627 RepID=UPI001FBBD5CA|nr:hypothetical protein [Methylobacterium sp. J-030]MCJ2067944.1 hypothetical protein [Methylobacterium sp. J-030]
MTPYLHGIGATVDLVRELCKRDPAMVVAFDRAIERPAGRPPETLDNIQGSAPKAPTGTSMQAGIRRIRKAAEGGNATAAAALARVEAGEQSVHSAMIGLGGRQRTVTLPDDDPPHASIQTGFARRLRNGPRWTPRGSAGARHPAPWPPLALSGWGVSGRLS